MTRLLQALLLTGLIGSGVAGTRFWLDYSRAIWGDDQIWWTPMPLALSLDQSRAHFELFLEDESLQTHLGRSSLTALGQDGMAYFVTPDLLKVRVNNWSQVKSSLLEASVYSAFALGVSLTLLLTGLIGLLMGPRAGRPTRARRGASIRGPREPDDLRLG